MDPGIRGSLLRGRNGRPTEGRTGIRKGVLIAAGRREWDLAAEVLLGPAAGLVEAERHAA